MIEQPSAHHHHNSHQPNANAQTTICEHCEHVVTVTGNKAIEIEIAPEAMSSGKQEIAPKTVPAKRVKTKEVEEAFAYTLDTANDCILALINFFEGTRRYVQKPMQAIDFLRAVNSSIGGNQIDFLPAAYETLSKALKKSQNTAQRKYIQNLEKQLKKMFVDIIVRVRTLEQNARNLEIKEVYFEFI